MSAEPGTRLPDLGPKGIGWVALQFVGLLATLAAPVWRIRVDDGPMVIALVGGVLLMLMGGLLLLKSFKALGQSLTALPAPKKSAELITTGPYRLARHPIYGALVMGCLGWAIAWTSLEGLIAAGATWLVLILKSLKEEAWLVEKYPDYPQYRAGTWRFFPIAPRH